MAEVSRVSGQAGPRDDGVTSAFARLEQRGASDSEWREVIGRIEAHVTKGHAARISDDYRARLLALIATI